MKKLILVCLLIIPLYLRAQFPDKLIINSIPSMGKVDPLYVLDDRTITKAELSKIKSDDIAEYGVIKPPGSVTVWGKKGENGVIIFTSRKAAVEAYKIKFFAFSAGYHTYLNAHNNDDSKVTYIVNGVKLKVNTNATVSTLYALHQEKIKSVVFEDKGGPVVHITATK
jgi:hypothetical protein